MKMSDKMDRKADAEVNDLKTEYIKLKLIGYDNTEIHFRVKIATEMKKVKQCYSDRVGVSVNCLRFFYNGNRIYDDESPKTLVMANDDIIEVYQEQIGGFC